MRALIALERALPAIAVLLGVIAFGTIFAPALGAIIWRFG
jgi:hypothetical protein